MFTWARYPFVRIVIFLIIGIWLGLNFLGFQFQALTTVIVALIGLIVLGSRRPVRFIRINYLYGINISVLFICLGYLAVWLHSASNEKQNLTHFNEVREYVAEVRSHPEEKVKSLKVLVEVKSIRLTNGWQKANGQVLVYLEKNDSKEPLFGDVLLISGQPEFVSGPKNPHEFNYRRYLENRNVYQTHWVKNENWCKIKKASGFDIFRYANLSRSRLEEVFDRSIDDAASLGVIKALVLGNKEELDPEIKTTFARAGVMHVLAVSGLHVGIIYLILVLVLKPFSLRLTGPWLASTIIILVLWAYAFITGMPPSVLRAVTMFSIIEIGRRMNRDSSTFNSLALSAFLLLWINPLLVTHVGFQLSYIAVTGILLLYKPINNLFEPKNQILRFLWQLIAVSIAAQLATAPLAAYYFNQFPTYFLISNIFVIPAVTILVWGGVLVLILGLISTTIAGILGQGIILVINAVEHILTIITNWPYSSFQGISLDIYDLLLIYSFIAVLIAIAILGSRQSLRIGIALIALVFLIRTIGFANQQSQANKIVFYSLNNGDWAVDLVGNGEYMPVSDSLLARNNIDYSIMPYRIAENLKVSDQKPKSSYIKNVGKLMVWQNKKILIAESCAHHLQEGGVFDFILQPKHPRYMDCYSDQNLLIKLVDEEGYVGHSLKKRAYIADLN